MEMEQTDPQITPLKKMVETDACVGMTKYEMDNMGKKGVDGGILKTAGAFTLKRRQEILVGKVDGENENWEER